MKGSSSYRDYALWRGDYLGGRCVLRDIEAVIATADDVYRRGTSKGHAGTKTFTWAFLTGLI